MQRLLTIFFILIFSSCGKNSSTNPSYTGPNYHADDNSFVTELVNINTVSMDTINNRIIVLTVESGNEKYDRIVTMDLSNLGLENLPKNIKDLAGELDGVRNWFLKDGVQFILDGVQPDEIREMMELREATREEKESSEANVMKTMGDFSPAFGMVGTLIGLVIMMFSMGGGGGDDAEAGDMAGRLGLSMGVALITTFYGALFANLIFIPFSEKLKSKNEENKKVQALIIEGVSLLAKKVHPIMVTERLNSYLQPADRIRGEA